MDAAAGAAARRIHRLDETVVNRIAAGEVVVRPASALKEMLENSLDAGATKITVTAKGGGIQLLQIQDDGCGIQRDDMYIVCERFTTSKLAKFEDLQSIQTFGFRGEALASISHVAHVTIVSMPRDSACAFRAKYLDGRIVPEQPGGRAEPRPCAGVPGTQITVEDLFYNVLTRRNALRSASEEYGKIVDVVTRYAIHAGGRGVSFTCKKHGAASADFHCQASATALDNVRAAFGAAVARELLPVSAQCDLEADGERVDLEVAGLVSNANYSRKKSVFILFINGRLVDCTGIKRAVEEVYADLLPKRTHPFLYLALRLPPQNVDVNVHPTKREVHFLHEEAVIAAVRDVVQRRLADANQSRTFLTQAVLPSAPQLPSQPAALAAQLDPGAMQLSSDAPSQSPARRQRANLVGSPAAAAADEPAAAPAPAQGPARARAAPQRMVRTDVRQTSIADAFSRYAAWGSAPLSQAGLASAAPCSAEAMPDAGPARQEGSALSLGAARVFGADAAADYLEEQEEDGAALASVTRKRGRASPSQQDAAPASQSSAPPPHGGRVHKRPRRPVLLTSVQNLLNGIAARGHAGLAHLLRRHKFVGVVDEQFSLVQYETRLCLVNHVELSKELFYQECIRNFANFARLRLVPAPNVRELLLIALADPRSGWQAELDGPKEDVARDLAQLLVGKGPMLDDYFAVAIDGDGALHSLPLLVGGYSPQLGALPLFLLRTATEVDWEQEQPCFDGIANQLALFYSDLPPLIPSGAGADADADSAAPGVADAADAAAPVAAADADLRTPASDAAAAQHMLQHVLFSAFRMALNPPTDFADDHTVLEVARLEKLYRVFERC